jgi:hypothetical protein
MKGNGHGDEQKNARHLQMSQTKKGDEQKIPDTKNKSQ